MALGGAGLRGVALRSAAVDHHSTIALPVTAERSRGPLLGTLALVNTACGRCANIKFSTVRRADASGTWYTVTALATRDIPVGGQLMAHYGLLRGGRCANGGCQARLAPTRGGCGVDAVRGQVPPGWHVWQVVTMKGAECVSQSAMVGCTRCRRTSFNYEAGRPAESGVAAVCFECD